MEFPFNAWRRNTQRPATYESDGTVSSNSSSQSELNPTITIPKNVSEDLSDRGLDIDEKGFVTWSRSDSRKGSGASSSTHPRDWSLRKRLFNTGMIYFLEFFMTMISNAGSAIALYAMVDLDVSYVIAVLCFTSVYLFGQAIGGLFLPPIAESYGTGYIYSASTLAYAILNAILAGCPALGSVIAVRFLTGVISAIPATVATGSLENMWDRRERILAVNGWIQSCVIGLSLGPPVGTYMSTSDLHWRWVFALSAIVTGVAVPFCFFMGESRPEKILQEHVKAVERRQSFSGLRLDSGNSRPTLREFARTSLMLPLRLFFTEWLVAVVSVMAAIVYGIVYLFSASDSVIYVQGLGFSPRYASLVPLAMIPGILLSSLVRPFDFRKAGKLREQGKPLQPEDKLLGFNIAAPILAMGLWWYALSVPPLFHVSPWIPIAPQVFFGFSVVEFDHVLSGYLCDAYGPHAGSASAPMAFIRSILSAVFPLLGRLTFRTLGSNHALFIFASLATAFIGAAVFLTRCGRTLREKSPFAQESEEQD